MDKIQPFKISVYITSYNQKDYLVEAIESVLNQTLKAFEIIIVDDCSTDGSQEVISGYASRHPDLIKTIYNKQNMGIAWTRNAALKAVKGDYVSFLDGDDRFLPAKLEKEAELLQANPDAQIAFSNFYSLSQDGQHLWLWADGETLPQGNIFRQTYVGDFPKNIHFRNELINYEVWKRIGFYDTKLTIYEDYDMRIRLTKRLCVASSNIPLVEYRRHDKGLSSLKLTQHLDNLEYIYLKNTYLLYDLIEIDQRYIKKRIKQKMAKLIRGAAIKELNKKQGSFSARILAIRYYIKSLKYQPNDHLALKLITMMLMPYNFYRWLERCYIKFKN